MIRVAGVSVALGCMRLPLDEDAAIATVHAALDGGARLLDVADVYGPIDEATHHVERTVARAVAAWPGDRGEVVIATKGGLVRREGRWFPDGRARHLLAAAAASAEALGGAPLGLWQWHARDPRVALGTSLRAVATIARRGLAREIGVCNVGVPELQAACDVAPVTSLQVELGPWSDGAVRSGVAAEALRRGLTVLAHTPLGGARGAARLARLPALAAIAGRLGVTPAEVVLAWMASLHPRLVPLPGATRPATAGGAARARAIPIDGAERDALDALFPRLATLRPGHQGRASAEASMRSIAAVAGSQAPACGAAASAAAAEVILLVGSPGAGKSTFARARAAEGWTVLDRDSVGGRLDAVATRLDAALAGGADRVVVDATYPTRAARRPVLEVAARRGVSVRCVWLDTPLERAAVHACRRLVARWGALPSPDALRSASRADPHAFGPSALFGFRRELEPPAPDEGFATIERVEPPSDAAPSTPRVVLLDLDGALWASGRGARAPLDVDDLLLDPARLARLRALVDDGLRLAGITWQPRVATGELTGDALDTLLDAVRAALGAPLDVRVCPHPPGPPVCWCRKPLPGHGVELMATLGVAASEVLFVGRTRLDASFARALGFAYAEAGAFFGSPIDLPPPPAGAPGAAG